MSAKIKRNKKVIFISILLLGAICIYIYQISRPTIIFHTYLESGYLGKISTFDGCIDKLYIKNHISKYRLPHIYNWKDDDEIGIFTKNYNDLLKKKDIDFWKLEVFLDENGFYVNHTIKPYFWQTIK